MALTYQETAPEQSGGQRRIEGGREGRNDDQGMEQPGQRLSTGPSGLLLKRSPEFWALPVYFVGVGLSQNIDREENSHPFAMSGGEEPALTSNRIQLHLWPAVWPWRSHFASLRLSCHTSSKNHSLHHSVEVKIEWDTVHKDLTWDFSALVDSNSSVFRLTFICAQQSQTLVKHFPLTDSFHSHVHTTREVLLLTPLAGLRTVVLRG